MRAVLRTLAWFPVELLRLAFLLLTLLLWMLWMVIVWLFGREPPRKPRRHCPCPDRIPEHVRRRPDPCLYSQSYLMQKGLPVTWNNPDIWLTELDGTPVSSSDLAADHLYRIHGRIWNASFDAALGVAVRCRFRNWGIADAEMIPVELEASDTEAVRLVDIVPWQHTVAQFTWRTPAQAGHYCIKVYCQHPDDLNTTNNVGQENTSVRRVPAGETFSLPMRVFNPDRDAARMRFEVDAYEISERTWRFPLETRRILLGRPPRLRLGFEKRELPAAFRKVVLGRSARTPAAVRWRYAGRRELFDTERDARSPVPEAWHVRLDGASPEQGIVVGPREARDVQLSVSVPPSARAGERLSLNVAGWIAERGPVGGATLVIEVE